MDRKKNVKGFKRKQLKKKKRWRKIECDVYDVMCLKRGDGMGWGRESRWGRELVDLGKG